ncbi:MAG: hypothetical protein C4293_02790 [Nitrospiraceae bacterium]
MDDGGIYDMKWTCSLLIIIIIMVSVFGMATAQGISSVCTMRDRLALSKAGYTKEEIETLCNQTADEIISLGSGGISLTEGQPPWVQWCVTDKGTCSLNPMLGQYPVGAPCNCYMPWGTYAGVAQ